MNTQITIKRKNKFLTSVKKYWWYYFMLLPGVAYFIIFKYAPMWGVTIAFKKYSIFKGFSASPWVGWENFKTLFQTEAFLRALKNNLIISFAKVLLGFPLPIILSLMINEIKSNKLKRGIQLCIILPNFISWIVINGLLFALFGQTSGALTNILKSLNYTGAMPNILGNKDTFRWVIIISYLWKTGGYSTIIYLAAIAGIDQNLYEAAQIDGASRWQQMIHITLSSLRPTIVMMLIFRLGDLMYAGFDQIFAISNYLTLSVSEIIDTYVYKLGMESRQFSLATAAGLFQNIIGFTLVMITNAIARRVDPDSSIV